MGLVSVRDEATKLVGHRFLNSQICLWIGICQCLVCIWGIAQHAHSYVVYRQVLRCDFEQGSLPLEAADAVIFDVGLFYVLWGMRGCVAEYLDGGAGRLAWCVSHVLSMAFSLPWAFASRPKPYFLWPLLFQQSLYGICLLILFLAALPRILPLLAEPHAAPLPALAVYILGTSLNFFLCYIAWHWYWHVDGLWSSAVRVRFGEIVRNANARSRRDKPRIPREPMGFSEGPSSSSSSMEFLPPAPVILATRVAPDDIENIHLRAQAMQKKRRRILPPTPQENSLPPTQTPLNPVCSTHSQL